MSELTDAYFRALFEQAPISMLVYDRDGRPLRVNAAFTALWGLTLADLAGYRILDDPQLVAAGAMPLVEQAFAGTPTVLPPFRYNAAAVGPDGVTRWAQASLYPVGDAAGQVREVVLLHIDVTALKTAELLAQGQTSTLAEALHQLVSEPHLPAYLAYVLRAVVAQVGAVAGYILRYDPGDTTLRLQTALRTAASTGVEAAEEPPPLREPLPADSAPALQLLRTGRSLLRLSVPQQRALFWPELERWHREQGHHEALVLALKTGETLLGVLGLGFATATPLSPSTEELLQALAAQAALALQLTRLAERGRSAAVLAERTRLAREIHDTLAQGLLGIIVQLQAAADAHTPPQAQEAHVQAALALARSSLTEARRSVQTLRVPTAGDGGFAGALMRLVQECTAAAPLRTAFALVGTPTALAPAAEGQLLRIAQEALRNALRHGQAREIRLELAFTPGRVRLQITDDGVGFDPADVPPDRFGLVGMHERALQLGGVLELRSAPGAGTSLAVEAPADALAQGEEEVARW